MKTRINPKENVQSDRSVSSERIISMTESQLRALVKKGVTDWKVHFDWTPTEEMPTITECVMKQILGEE
jgi:hypothetical protein